MKTMLQKQVYSPIRNIVTLTFIISGCSGELKLRMSQKQTRSQNNVMVTKFKTIWILELPRVLNVKSGILVFGIRNLALMF